MRIYEVVFVAAPTLTSEELDAFTSLLQGVVEERNGKVLKIDNWGKKSLAYRIKRYRDAYYVVLTLEADGSVIAELERRFRVADHVIRFLSVRIDEDQKRSEKMKAARQKKASRRPTPPSQVEPASEAAQV